MNYQKEQNETQNRFTNKSVESDALLTVGESHKSLCKTWDNKTLALGSLARLK